MKRSWIAPLMIAVLLASCGVPTQSSFDRADESAFDVDPPDLTTPVSEAPSDERVLPVRPYFVGEGGLTPATTSLATYDTILNALQTRPEDGSGLRTAVTADAVVGISNDGAGVLIELAEPFQSLPPEEQRLAAAQLVLTVTDRSAAVRVTFALSGQPVDVPTADNSVSIGGSVTRADYVSLLAHK